MVDFDFIVLGSGSSGAVPSLACLTHPDVDGHACEACRRTTWTKAWSSVKRRSAERNTRSNTGAIIRFKSSPDAARHTTIMIDCGKTFFETAKRLFPTFKLREIDAVILTHYHSDAVNGLDDLRAWTMSGAIQSSVKIYCTAETKRLIRERTPWLVSETTTTTGSGWVPKLDYKVVEETEKLYISGLELQLLPVHHGPDYQPDGSKLPLICLGVLVERAVLWLSDVSYIPAPTWDILARHVAVHDGRNRKLRPSLKAVFIDCLTVCLDIPQDRLAHFALPHALETVLKLGAPDTFIIDLPHELSHEGWTAIGEHLGDRSFIEAVLREDRGTRLSDEVIIRKGHDIPANLNVFDRFDLSFDPRNEDHKVLAELAELAVRHEGEQAGSLLLSPDFLHPVRFRPAFDGLKLDVREDGYRSNEGKERRR